jgi:hypothetical protein
VAPAFHPRWPSGYQTRRIGCGSHNVSTYGTVGVGAATALPTLLSGWLYAGMGPRAFAVMTVLCLLALPLAAGLRHRQEPVR